MGKIVLGYWNCKQCGTTSISGELRDCPNCGKPRPDGTKFDVDKRKTITYVSEETEKQVRLRGRDWTCEYCNAMNSGLDTICPGCGAPRYSPSQDAETAVRQPESTRAYDNITVRKPELHEPNRQISDESETTDDSYKTVFERLIGFIKDKAQTIAVSLATMVAIPALVMTLIFVLTPKDVDFQITDMSWKYTIEVQKLTTVDESDWTLPSDGRLQYTREEIHHYTPVIDHYETEWYDVLDGYDEEIVGYKDLGNGYMEEITTQIPRYRKESREVPVYEDEPVYQTKYYYEIDKWLYHRAVVTSAHDKNPYWGKLNLHSLEREGSKKQEYRIYGVDDDNNQHDYEVDYAVWIEYDIDDQAKGKVDVFGHFTPTPEQESEAAA